MWVPACTPSIAPCATEPVVKGSQTGEHGPDGRLPAPPHDESGHTWHHPDAQLFAITKYGLAKLIQQPDYQTNMPVYDGVEGLWNHRGAFHGSRHSGPRRFKARHDQVNAQYQKSLDR